MLNIAVRNTPTNGRRHCSFLLGVFLSIACLAAFAQQSSPPPANSSPDSGKSLAEVAKESKKKTSHAKKLVTDEDMDAQAGPLPKLSFEDPDNAEEIVQAFGDFQGKHTKEETELVLHDWFRRYDSMLDTAIRENNQTTKRRADTVYNGYSICQDSPSYETCEQRRLAEVRGAHQDQADLHDNLVVVGRIQNGFSKVRSGIARFGVHYDWFKIRSANGIGTY